MEIEMGYKVVFLLKELVAALVLALKHGNYSLGLFIEYFYNIEACFSS